MRIALLLLCSVALCGPLHAQATRPALSEREQAERMAMTERARAERPLILAQRKEAFLAIERAARLADSDQQKAELPAIYRQLGPTIFDGAMSESRSSQMWPANLLVRDRSHLPSQLDTRPWIAHLDELAKTMTPEQVVDGILAAHGDYMLHFVTRRRGIDLFLRQRDELHRLVDDDLKSDNPDAIRLAMRAIGTVGLAEYADPVAKLPAQQPQLDRDVERTLLELRMHQSPRLVRAATRPTP